MNSKELYDKYMEAYSKRWNLESDLNNLMEDWKNGKTELNTKSVEQQVEEGYKKLDELRKQEEELRKAYEQMKNLEDKKISDDIAIRNALGQAPTDMNVVGGVLATNAADSHLIAEKKNEMQMLEDKKQMLEKIKSQVKVGELSLAQASELLAKVNGSFDFYEAEKEIQGRHM